MRNLVLLSLFVIGAAAARADRVEVTFVDDEARAVLAILGKRAAGSAITEADWQRVFASEGYARLKAREHSMERAFEDDAFRAFVMSDELLAKRKALSATLEEWMRADLSKAGARALAYLPSGAKIRAKVYPSIKPATNSFVFETTTNPAIFMYIEPLSRAEFERTIAHELHHVGFAGACPDSGSVSDARKWLSAFGEGIATLAAAGGPKGAPQSQPKIKAEWDAETARFDANFAALEEFFTAVADGKLTGEAQSKRAFEFFGFVGPWYTVGYRMAVVIETTLGRDALIGALCDMRQFLPMYNRAAGLWEKKHKGEKLPRWPDVLIGKL